MRLTPALLAVTSLVAACHRAAPARVPFTVHAHHGADLDTATISDGARTVFPPPPCAGGEGVCAMNHEVAELARDYTLLATAEHNGTIAAVYLSHQSGNACAGGRGSIVMLRASSSRVVLYAMPIGACGGDPSVDVADDAITVSIPAHPFTRGNGSTPAEAWTWSIDSGALTRATPTPHVPSALQ